MSGNGFIKLHRKILYSELYQEPNIFLLWTSLLLDANWDESKIYWEGKQKILPRGSFLMNQVNYSERLEWSRKKLRRCLDYLKSTDRIRTETGRRGTIITICKYDDYQVREKEEEQKGNRNGAPTAPPTAPPTDTQKRIKELKNNIVLSKDNTPAIEPEKKSKIMDLWNSNCGPLPKIKTWTNARTEKWRVRKMENSDLNYWSHVFKKMGLSNFCREGKWATFDWVIKNDTNHVKVSEGNYDNKDGLKFNGLEQWAREHGEIK